MRRKLKNLYFLSAARDSACSEFSSSLYLNVYLRSLKALDIKWMQSQQQEILLSFTIILTVVAIDCFTN
jgi:hypothetical protein